MRRLARTLEASLAVPESRRELRKEAVGQIPSAIDRNFVRGIDVLAAKYPNAGKTTLNGLAHIIAGAGYIGHGAFASVYKVSPEEVVKVYRHTAVISDDEKHKFAHEREQMCAALRDFLGTMVTNQTFSVGEHPLGKYVVVKAHQPFVEGGALDLFDTDTLQLHADEVAAYCERQATGQSELTALVEGTFSADEATGLVPDLNGRDNFRLVGATEQLRLIDSEPISRQEHPNVHDHILRQAELLGAFIE